MTITVIDQLDEHPHRFAALSATCSLANPSDPFVNLLVQAVREAYGESEIAQSLLADEDVASTFDLTLVIRTFRRGLPNPADEGKKPHQLRNSRSETAEFVAKQALSVAYGVQFPSSPHKHKQNANQPILGFDLWGVTTLESSTTLVLGQVKGSDESNSPPAICDQLIHECKCIPRDADKLSRALSSILLQLPDGPIRNHVLTLMETLASDREISIIVAPVLVRGTTAAKLSDLESIRQARDEFSPSVARAATVSVGVDLYDLGVRVLSEARNS